MANRKIVIVTASGDPHAEDVMVKLAELGQGAILLNTDDIPLDLPLTLSLGRERPVWAGRFVLGTSGRTLDIDEIGSVWWRRPGHYFGIPAELTEQEREFAKGELEQALGGLWATLDCHWMSHPERIRQASWKLEQLERAAALGFDVPRTVVTTDPDAVREFYDLCDGHIVFKVLTDTLLGAVRMADKYPDRPPPEQLGETRTTLITAAELEELDSVRLVPCLFQEYVPKRFEYRVTVIGDDLFAAEIDSQSREGTRVDWRNWQNGGFEIPYRAVTLPGEVAERCLALVRGYDLQFSAMDLILTLDGRWVFLENNPNGQFIFVEKLAPELEMTAALAAWLIKGAQG